ncbi:MAG TPA: universal stress protein [Vicinamibacterales bacterium]|nr:universal stress protein [Vicinamibacterales bacterium]
MTLNLPEGVVNLAFKTIVVATDFSDASNLALEYARVLANRFDAGLRVLHVVQTPMPLGSEMYVPEVMTVAERAVQEVQQQLTTTLERIGGDNVIGQVLMGLAPRKIVEYATDHEADLIVMGTHGRGAIAHLLMGSVAERVVRTAPCPVFTVRDTEALRWASTESADAAAGTVS